MSYELFYWPMIQGRGELIRLAFEARAVEYADVCRRPESEDGGVPALIALLKSASHPAPPFAPPILRHEGLVISQTANVLQYLAPRLDSVPADDASRWAANQSMLTVMDFLNEVHDTHHPISVSLYYEDQKPAALLRTGFFVRERMPKFLGYFERLVAASTTALSYVDLALFQTITGLGYAFRTALGQLSPRIPRLLELTERVRTEPNVAAYLSSARRLPFNESGLFRKYPELDLSAG